MAVTSTRCLYFLKHFVFTSRKENVLIYSLAYWQVLVELVHCKFLTGNRTRDELNNVNGCENSPDFEATID